MTNASAAQAALMLSRVRRTGEQLVTFPEALVPQDRAAAYAIQDEIIALEGEVGGWKIASGPRRRRSSRRSWLIAFSIRAPR